MRSLPLIAALLIATPSAALPVRETSIPAIVPIPGAEAEDCIPLTGIRETRVRDDATIDFTMRGGRTYRNTLPHACPGLGFEQAFGYGTSLSRLCSTDIITVIRRGGGPMVRGASCGLGRFIPVKVLPAAAPGQP